MIFFSAIISSVIAGCLFSTMPLLAINIDHSSLGDLPVQRLQWSKHVHLRPPSSIDKDLVIDQIIGLEESRLALLEDTAARFRNDYETIKSIKALIESKRPKKVPAELELALKNLKEDYSHEDLSVISKIVFGNVNAFSLEAIAQIREDLEKTKFYLGRGQYPWSYDPLTLFKHILYEHMGSEVRLNNLLFEYTASEGSSGVPSTDPARFHELNKREKWQVQNSVDQMAIQDQQLLLLYDLLPPEAIEGELRQYLSIPSLYIYLQGYIKTHDHTSCSLIDFTTINSKNILEKWAKPFTPYEAVNLDIEVIMPIVNSVTCDDLDTNHKRPIKDIADEIRKAREKAKKIEKKKRQNKKLSAKSPLEPSLGDFEEQVIDEPLPALLKETSQPLLSLAEPMQQVAIAVPEEKEERKSSTPSSTSSSSVVDSRTITLKKKEQDAYNRLFKANHSSQEPLKWKQFEKLFKALGGTVLKNKGNGSCRTLSYKMKKADGTAIESSRFIHEPHAIHGSTFGYQSLDLLRGHFTSWGLAPGQGTF